MAAEAWVDPADGQRWYRRAIGMAARGHLFVVANQRGNEILFWRGPYENFNWIFSIELLQLIKRRKPVLHVIGSNYAIFALGALEPNARHVVETGPDGETLYRLIALVQDHTRRKTIRRPGEVVRNIGNKSRLALGDYGIDGRTKPLPVVTTPRLHRPAA
jgi:hypothetical protein